MSLRITQNIEAMTASRYLQHTSMKLTKSMEKLSSGYRINSAADDAAGLGISESMRSQVRGLAQAQRNIQDGISMVQTAEGNLDEVHSMLQRIRELAVQYQNGTVSPANHTAIQSEVNQLISEIERIGTTAKFNGVTLLAANALITFQVGANDGEQIAVSLISLGATLGTAAYSLTAAGAQDISEIDAAIGVISNQRSVYGAIQNRLEHTLANLATYEENLTAAESRIRDVDMADEMANFTKLQILQQAGTAMLAQANVSNQSVLQLLK